MQSGESGMLTREQRMKAMPGLLNSPMIFVERDYPFMVYQALREITNENLPNDPQPGATVLQQRHREDAGILAGGVLGSAGDN